ncbi:HECT-domain (ubiquitin-transferase) domain-containing protein [Cardiosporidium cionae]|uniref:HECT-type E3 ubiquitin transferase n=1 Tax=Cardiosporidium cionae TaxID=476202 RepID=A0ABQ7J5X3_9APIC|nr:HECT-domain (ubiquitin-transferase) domain-containing protein [Cardiosporidium cionae]|eukprot:KAF8819368.1 HECT-domain (ubiquitin-transferase) domain-containing protein [Cardiosporidium cionae]
MNHLLRTIHHLIVGAEENSAGIPKTPNISEPGYSTEERDGRETSLNLETAEVVSSPAVISANAPPTPEPDESHRAAGEDQTKVTTTQDKTLAVKEDPVIPEHLIIEALSTESVVVACELICNQKFRSIWSTPTTLQKELRDPNGQFRMLLEIVSHLYQKEKFSACIERCYRDNALLLCRRISIELNRLSRQLYATSELRERSELFEEVAYLREHLEPRLYCFWRLSNSYYEILKRNAAYKQAKQEEMITVSPASVESLPAGEEGSAMEAATEDSAMEASMIPPPVIPILSPPLIEERKLSSASLFTAREKFRELFDGLGIDGFWAVLDDCLRSLAVAYPILTNKHKGLDAHSSLPFYLDPAFNATGDTASEIQAPAGSGSNETRSLQQQEALADVEEAPGMAAPPFILNQLLPLLDCFLRVSQIAIGADYGLKDMGTINERILSHSTDMDESMCRRHAAVVRFCETHRKALNVLIRQTPSLLKSSLSLLLILAPMSVNFESKRNLFRQRLKELRWGARHDPIRLSVRRDDVFMDSYVQLRHRSGDEMKGRLNVHFQGESGIDAGGLTREWFGLMAKEMFNPNYVLFRREGTKAEFNHPNPLSHVDPDHLRFFRFIGRVIGKALYDGQHLEAYFCRSFYKHMLGRKTLPSDAESVDPELYSNLQKVMEYSLEDLGLELYFSTEMDEFGSTKTVDLIPNGRNTPVTDQNKQKYVQLICEHKVSNAIREQLDSFLSGFHELIPPSLISIFDDKELELLISGMPEIDLDDLQKNTEYHNYTPESQVVQWFWEVLEEFDQNKRAAFLQFLTGTSRVPLEGFRNLMGMRGPQRFSIHREYGDERLPSAHTCFNQLDMPEYSSKERLRAKLLQAITEGKEGFGFA